MKKLLILSLVFAGAAMAAEQSVRIDVREQQQKARIVDGVVDGELTKRETAKLAAGQRHVKALESRAKADGHISVAERVKLEAAQDRQNGKIYQQKHDAQERK